MAFVVTEACIDCRYTDCVDVCPMSCFYEGPNFLVIDPDECIDCSVCVPECPVDAIFDAREVPVAQRGFIALNARLAKEPGWQRITRSKEPLPGADAAASVDGKLHRLKPR